jgi:hypothetical protein
MKTFTLSYSYIVLKNGYTEISFKPSDELIDDYIVTYKIYNSLSDALSDVDDSIIELTPIMFDSFQNMEDIPQYIKDQFIL